MLAIPSANLGRRVGDGVRLGDTMNNLVHDLQPPMVQQIRFGNLLCLDDDRAGDHDAISSQ